ncbi:hypothetical protein NHQ30_005767 [Ciborinia camelliae]|nr:hypothetical protein NHQ30_005767 [Ciborinia camelliae]
MSISSKLSLQFHRLLVLTGFRPSVATIFRSLMIAPIGSTLPSIIEASHALAKKHTFSPCYVILCNGTTTIVIEKDLHKSHMRSSSTFIIQANHDIYLWQLRNKVPIADHLRSPFPNDASAPNPFPVPPPDLSRNDPKMQKYQEYWGMENSIGRYKFLREQWTAIQGPVDAVGISQLKNWMEMEPVHSTSTHFMCLLDPTKGELRWLKRGMEEAHESC